MIGIIENNKVFSKKTEPYWNIELVELWTGNHSKRNWKFYMAKSEFG